MIGDNNDGKAFELKQELLKYKDFLIEITTGSEVIKETINNALNLDNRVIDKPGKERYIESWENYTFQSEALGFVLIRLTQIQSDIKYCESEVMTYLYNRMLSEINLASLKKNK
jgi:hypothetical protein